MHARTLLGELTNPQQATSNNNPQTINKAAIAKPPTPTLNIVGSSCMCRAGSTHTRTANQPSADTYAPAPATSQLAASTCSACCCCSRFCEPPHSPQDATRSPRPCPTLLLPCWCGAALCAGRSGAPMLLPTTTPAWWPCPLLLLLLLVLGPAEGLLGFCAVIITSRVVMPLVLSARCRCNRADAGAVGRGGSVLASPAAVLLVVLLLLVVEVVVFAGSGTAAVPEATPSTAAWGTGGTGHRFEKPPSITRLCADLWPAVNMLPSDSLYNKAGVSS